MKEQLAAPKKVSDQKPTIRLKMGLANFMAELKQHQESDSKSLVDFKVAPYPKNTFLKAYDPLESL